MNFENTFQKNFFFYFPVFLFILLPVTLITGPFLSDLSISIISLIFLIYCIKEKDYSFFKNKYVLFFLFFWGYLFLNSLFNNTNIDSIKISFFYFRFGLFAIAVVALLNTSDYFLKYFFYSLVFCFTILVFDGFYQFSFGENIFGWSIAENNRLGSFFKDELILGSYLSRLWPIFFALSIKYFQNNKKVFHFLIILFILSETLIFLSGERTSFFYINLSALFVLIFSNNLKKLRLLTLILSLILILFISLINPAAKERMIDQTLSQIVVKNSKENNNKIYTFSEQHTHHYLSAYKMFLDNRFFGVGIKNFRSFCGNDKYNVSELSCSTHPHNTYIQILSETGLFGFMFVLIVLSYFIINLLLHTYKKLKKSYRFNDFQICILSGVSVTLWPFAPTGNFFNNWLSIIYYLYLPLLFWSIEDKKKKRKKLTF